MKSRKSTILFIGEPQSIYDPKEIKFDEIIDWEIKLAENMWQIRRELGVKQAIYVLATPIGKEPTTQITDFNFRNVRSAATSQCFVELAYKDSSTWAFLPHDPNSFAGLCFYRDGFITINKETRIWRLVLRRTFRRRTYNR